MTRLALSLLAAIFIATVGLGWLFDQLYRGYAAQNAGSNDSLSEKTAVSVMEQMGANLSHLINLSTSPQQIINDWPANQQAAQNQSTSNDIYNNYTLSLQQVSDTKLPPQLTGRLFAGEPLVLETHSSINIYYYLPNHQQNLILTAPLLPQDKSNSWAPILFTSLFYMCLLLLMFIWLMPLLKRLLSLRKTAKSFGEGNLSQRINIGSGSYIKDLEVEFNRMAQRIEDLVADVKLLGSAVSHDLRTPLASIRFGLDALEEEDDPIRREKYQQRIGRNVDEMITLVETLLNYARLDQTLQQQGENQQASPEIDLRELLQHIVKNKTTNATVSAEKRLLLHCPDSPITLKGNANYLSMVFNNLVQNALQYAESEVIVEVQVQQNNIAVTVADDGDGIAESEQQSVFKPFVRGQSATTGDNRKNKGYGVGLAIVQRIVFWHKGEIKLTNNTLLKGANFCVTFAK